MDVCSGDTGVNWELPVAKAGTIWGKKQNKKPSQYCKIIILRLKIKQSKQKTRGIHLCA